MANTLQSLVTRNERFPMSLHNSFEARVGGDAGETAPLGNRLSLYFVEIGGEVDGPGAADIASHPKAIYGSAIFEKVSDPLRVKPAADKDAYFLEAG